jgi:hypothetical protein
VVDGSHIRALQRGLDRPFSVDRDRTGSKHHLICRATGVMPAISLTGGNRNDVTQLLPLANGVGSVAGKGAGRASAPTGWVLAARGYDRDKYRVSSGRVAPCPSSPGAAPGTAPGSAGCGHASSVQASYLAFMLLGCAVVGHRMLGWPDAR